MKLRGLALGIACLATSAFAQHGTIKIYDAKFVPEIVVLFKKGQLVLEDGKKKSLFVTKDAYAANENISLVRDYYYEKFGRNSWDDKGSDIIAQVNVNKYFAPIDILGQKENAAWAKTQFMFGAGSSKGLDDMVYALDVVGHEYTHAVVQTTSDLKYEGQSGALNEHLADVFGSLINIHYKNPAKPYLIGSSILRGKYAGKAEALRNMMNPELGLRPQPSHMNDLDLPMYSKFKEGCVSTSSNDQCGVHTLSGIPNKMAALVISRIHEDEAAKLFYNVMTKRLKSDAKFSDYRTALMEECKSLSSDTCAIVDDSLTAVGI